MTLLLNLVFISLVSYVLSVHIPDLLLNNGRRIPIVGLGTSGITEEAVREAINDGYRHIDTSLNYKPDAELTIGKVLKQVLKEGKVKREELFIVTKLEPEYHPRKRVAEGIKKSLTRLGLDYIDLYLVHSPDSVPANVTLVETWQGMQDVLKANLTRSIGVSNFNEEQLEEIYAKGVNVKPVTNQVICNPYNNQKKLLSYLNKNNITLTAYSPLGGRHDPNLLKESKLIEIGKKYNVSVAQVALRYQIERNIIVIPKSNTAKYIKENINLFGFKLTQTDIKEIETLNRN